MFHLGRQVRWLRQPLLIHCRFLSVSKSDLVESSRHIQQLLGSNENESSLYSSLSTIHSEYPSTRLAVYTKNVYQNTSSTFNSAFVQLETDRTNRSGDFQDKDDRPLVALLRYIRYLQVAFSYRYITLDVNQALRETSDSVLDLAKNEEHFQQRSLPLACELSFFVCFLTTHHPLSHVNSLLSSTSIVNYLSEYLFSSLSEKSPPVLVEQLSQALHSIIKTPSTPSIEHWPHTVLKYLSEQRVCSLPIIEYLVLIQHNTIQQSSTEMLALLNEYLLSVGVHEETPDAICQLLILISSCQYSHEVFQREVTSKIRNQLKQSKERDNSLADVKLCSRLIYYLCLTDPTNRFHSRATIVELSRKLNENIHKEISVPQWIVQAQHGMMLCNIYNYQLLFTTVQRKVFPLLFRDMGVYNKSVHRQLFDIHHALTVDRPALHDALLNPEMLAYANEVSEQYRSFIRSDQKTFQRFLTELKQEIGRLYGPDICQIIDTDKHHPYILFDFLEVNLPDTDELRGIGINTKQRIAVMPILNSMLIKQQRANGSLTRVYSVHTSARYRLIEKNGYTVLPIFQGEFLRAVRDKTFRTVFETNLALKGIPHLSDSSAS